MSVILESMSQNLNHKYKKEERYKAILDHGKGWLVINAGPGTGKTFGLIQKIGKLLQDDNDPDKIYYLTFANNILNAFKKDVKKPATENGLGKPVEELGVHASTLHSLAFKIIKSYEKRLKLPELIEPVDLSLNSNSVTSKIFRKDIYCLKKKLSGIKWNKFKKEIKELKTCWQSNVQIEDRLTGLEEIINKINKKYLTLPWDMLVPKANEAIKEYGLPKWLEDARHFLIDEYQDFNPSEQELISLVSQPSDSVVIVGDVDQSIYSGRSASPKGLKSLATKEGSYSVNFAYCWRCPQLVVESANRILSIIDPATFNDKELRPVKEEKGFLKLKELKSCREEIDYIANFINKIKGKNNSDIIILFPIKKGIEYYKNELMKRGVNGYVDFQDTSEEFAVAYLKLVAFGTHRMSERLLLSEYPNLERKFRDELLYGFIESDDNLGLIPTETFRKSKRSTLAKEQYREYRTRLSNLKSRDPKKIIKELSKAGITNIDSKMIEELLEEKTVKLKQSNLDNVINRAKTKKEPQNVDVHLLTMHGSKGLSKDWVIIPAFEDKWLPGNSESDALKEKHRLVYVAVTRSKKGLLITYPRTRAQKDPLNYSPLGTRWGISRYSRLLGPT